MKIVLLILLSLNIVLAIEKEENTNNTVKTSELELFLFKIGFQSLLNDVDITKNKANLNEEELNKLNSKIEIIMDELYKNKRVLKSDSSSVVVTNSVNNNELKKLKEEMSILKLQMKNLQESKKENVPKISKAKINTSSLKAKINTDKLLVRTHASLSAPIVDTLLRNEIIKIEKCSRYDWCKIKGEKKYVPKYLLKFE